MPETPNPKSREAPPPRIERVVPSPFAYAELDVKTNFSFLRGASHADELVYRAAELGYRAIAVTDFNSMAGAVRMHEAAKDVGLQLLVGARLTLTDAPDLLVWAPDRSAYARLCWLLTLGKRRAEKGECNLSLGDFLEENDGLIAAVVTYGILREEQSKRQAARKTARVSAPLAVWRVTQESCGEILDTLRDAMGDRISLAVSCGYGSDDASNLERLCALSRQFDIPLLATNDVYYHDPGRRMLQDVLTCVRHGCTIREAGFRLFPNGERYLKPPEKMHRLFADCPQAIRRAVEIAERCDFSLKSLKYEYPDELVPAGKTSAEYLSDLTWQGAAQRYPGGIPQCVRDRILHELKLIGQLKFEPYFLTVYDLVRFARSRGILCQGRGSAANSAVCYCIGVTSVDPDQIDVLFERFISAARNEPPDIDVDFEHERREEVIQYVYEKYGRDRAGMTATVITYRGRSAIRDVGKAMGLSLDMVDSMAGKLDWWDRGVLEDDRIRQCGLDPTDRTIRLVLALAAELLGFPRHLSQHVGGMVMTRGLLCEMVPIENATMPARTVIEWDKDDIDALGLLKVDALALGMLTCISKAFALINQQVNRESLSWHGLSARVGGRLVTGDGHVCGNTNSHRGGLSLKILKEMPPGHDVVFPCRTRDRSSYVPVHGLEARATIKTHDSRPLELHNIPPKDPAVYDMICDADTIGVFQIESRAQMSMLPRLKPRCFYDLVIEVAIVRPGPIQGNMVHPYLKRRSGEEPVTFPSEALGAVLHKTLGVPLFQEQAMRIAMVAAGFSADEADKLRRAMAAWRRSGVLETFQKKIVEGMIANGYRREFAEQCYLQIKGFGEYGFPESHAASFALLVYVSAWIKRHHPAAFAAALINSQPMGFYQPAQIVRDAKDHGVEIRPADVNESEWDCTLEEPEDFKSQISDPKSDISNLKSSWGKGGPALRLGFRQLKGMRQAHADRIVAVRTESGRFTSVNDFHLRTGLPVATLKILAESDAFGSIELSRRQALWEVLRLKDQENPILKQKIQDKDEPEVSLPGMEIGQEVMIDYSTIGLSLKRHPVSLVREELERRGIISAQQLLQTLHGWVKVAGLVLIRQRPGTASGIVFETIEDETGIVNLIVKPEIYDRYRPAARHAGLLQCDGYVQRSGQVVHVMAKRLHDLSDLLAGYELRSRDFH